MTRSGIYKITNTINGRVYIGSAAYLKSRKWDHWKTLRAGCHRNRFLQRAWHKYGEDNFNFEVLEYVEDKNLLIEREQFFLDQLSFEYDDPKRCYNICRIAGSLLGTTRTEESRAKMSAAAIGRIISPEHRAKLSGARKGIKWSEERRARAVGSRTGFRHTEEAKARISAAKSGVKQTPENVEKRAAKIRGVPKSEAHKLALREVHRAFTQEQVDEMVRRRKAGETYVEIAKDFDTTKDTVRNWCLREGGENGDRVMPEALRQEIFRRRQAGESLRAICAACKVAKVTVNKVYAEVLSEQAEAAA